MKLRKVLLHSLLFGLFFLSSNIFAQPSPACVFEFNPYEISDLGLIYDYYVPNRFYPELFSRRINSPYIFVGRLISRNPRQFQIESIRNRRFSTLNVTVVSDIVGKIDRMVDLSIRDDCTVRERIEVGGEYIFFAEKISDSSFTGLVSDRWSGKVNGMPQKELDKIVKNIIAYRKGAELPAAVGYLIKQKQNPHGDYLNNSFRYVWQEDRFKNDWRIKKLQYDPEYAEPLKGVKITAKNDSGGEFTTKTDASGRFEFDKLPDGTYVMAPNVPITFKVVGKCWSQVNKHPGELMFTVPAKSEKACNYATMRFDVAPAGRFEAEIELGQGNWIKGSSRPSAFLIGADSRTNQINGIFSGFRIPEEAMEVRGNKLVIVMDKVMAGEYVLRIDAIESRMFYPNAKNVSDASIFKIKEGKTTRLTATVATLTNYKFGRSSIRE